MNKQIPEGWRKSSIGEITSTNSLFSDGDWVESKDQDPTGANRLIQLADIGDGIFINKSSRYMNDEQFERLKCTALEKNDILIARMPEPLGRACLYPLKGGKAATVVDVAILRTKNANHYWLMSAINSSDYRHQIDLNASGTTRTRIARGILSNIEILEPPLPEQQKIATILSSVDTVIEKTRAQIDKLKHLKIGMMQQLLTQGIGHTEFKNTPIGRIPKTWKVISLGKAGSWKGGGTPSKANKEFWNGNIPWVSPKDMKSEFIEKTEDYITEHAITASSTNSIPTGSILIVARSGILKHTLPVAIAAVDVTINQDMKALIVNDKVLALYLFHYLQANNHKVLRATLKAGNTVESLDFSEFSQYQIPLPPVSEQQKIIDVMESIANRLRSKQQLLKSYELTKKALMQDLLTGKVRISRINYE